LKELLIEKHKINLKKTDKYNNPVPLSDYVKKNLSENIFWFIKKISWF
jgi:hypothetical protein